MLTRARLKRTASAVGLLEPMYELRARLLDLRARHEEETSADGLPLPPPRLRRLVGGTTDPAHFVASGARAAAAIRSAAMQAGVDLDSCTAVLDFGCGSGRTARHLRALGDGLHGVDVNPELVGWCAGHLPFGSYAVCSPEPPLELPADEYDVIFAVSVFTHLSERSQHRWAAELARILRPGGLLIMTTHGAGLAAQALTSKQLADFDRGRIVVCYPGAEGRNLCAAYHPPGSTASLATELEAVIVLPEAVESQDVHVLRRTGLEQPPL